MRFLNQRAKVKVTIMFRGRENPHRAGDLLLRLADEIKELGVVESPPLLDGRNMVMQPRPAEERQE